MVQLLTQMIHFRLFQTEKKDEEDNFEFDEK